MPGKTSKIQLDGAFAKREATNGRKTVLPGGWWLWCLLGLALGLGVWIAGRRYLRNELALRLTSADSGAEALESIDALMRLDGDAAIDVSRALGHPDFVVAHAAFRALNQQLDSWNELDSAEKSRRMALLVSELERMPREADQDHRILVTGLASRLYADALSSHDEVAGQLLDRCKRIMDRKALTPSSAQTDVEPAIAASEGLAPIESSLRDTDAYDDAPAALPPIESAGSASGARTSTASEPARSLPRDPMPRMSSSADAVESPSDRARFRLTGTPSRQATLVDRQAPIRLSDTEESERPIGHMSSAGQEFHLEPTELEDANDHNLHAARPFDASGDSNQANHDEVLTDDSLHAAADEESRGEEAIAGIDALPIDQLVRLLSSVQPRVAQAAALALRRKGMSDDKLDLAMQLAVGSSSERMNILSSLGTRSDLDPRPWLLWMAGEGDATVREQAVGMLGPLLDQDVRRQLRLLLNQERDERVAQTIRRVLVQ